MKQLIRKQYVAPDQEMLVFLGEGPLCLSGDLEDFIIEDWYDEDD